MDSGGFGGGAERTDAEHDSVRVAAEVPERRIVPAAEDLPLRPSTTEEAP